MTENKTTVFVGKEGTNFYRLLTLKMGLQLEMDTGMKLTRGRSAYAIVKSEFGFKGNKAKVLAQLEEYIEKEKMKLPHDAIQQV